MAKFWQSAKRWLPGMVISLGCVIAILYFVDLRKFADAIRQANIYLLLTYLVSTVLWLAVRGLVWRVLLREKASYRDVFMTLSEGYLLNNFLPFRLGEIGRAFLLSRKSELTFMEILPTIVIERVFDLALSALILLSAVPFVVGASGAEQIAYVVGGVVLAGMLFLYVLARNNERALEIFNRLSVRWPALQRVGGDFLKSFFAGLAVLTDGWLFLRFLGLMLINWAIAVAQFFILLLAFFPAAQLVWAMFGLGAAAFGGAVPSLPGAVGTYEGALGGALTLVTHDQSGSLAAAVVAHILSYISTGVLGVYALSTEGQTLSGVYQQLMKFRQTNQAEQ